jgi:hypothetical protein
LGKREGKHKNHRGRERGSTKIIEEERRKAKKL